MTISDKLERMKNDIDEVYEAGKEAEWNGFWDVYQANGTRTDYRCAFRISWNDSTFRPKYDVVAVTGTEMFAGSAIVDIAECLERSGVRLDTSNLTRIEYAFSSAVLQRIPEISFAEITTRGYASGVFGWSSVRTIDKIILKADGSTPIQTDWFEATSNLENVRFEGTIGESISFQSCSRLTAESMKDIINHLADYSGTDKANTYKLTLVEECWTRLEADSAAPDSGTWREYVQSLGWTT